MWHLLDLKQKLVLAFEILQDAAQTFQGEFPGFLITLGRVSKEVFEISGVHHLRVNSHPG